MCWAPLIADAFVRVSMLAYIFGHSENEEIAEELWHDKFTLFSMIGDILCIIPFVVRAAYLQPNTIRLGQDLRVLLRVLELLSVSRILRSTKDIPAIKTIRLALSRAAKHLVLPIFFFFAFNVFAAVLVYFSEPCYNIDTCPWLDLFDASFFSVVTMTTTGYGDQVPYYLTTRMISLVIMIFGALFISLPLAIIGNEYDGAWIEVSESAKVASDLAAVAAAAAIAEKAASDQGDQSEKASQDSGDRDRDRGIGRASPCSDGRRSADLSRGNSVKVFESIAEEEEEENEKATDEEAPSKPAINFDARMTPFTDDGDGEDEDGVMSNYSRICALGVCMRAELDEFGALTPGLLLNMCELRGWLLSTRWQIANCLKAALGLKKYVTALVPAPAANAKPVAAGGRRRLSMFLGGRAGGIQVRPAVIELPTLHAMPEAVDLQHQQIAEGDRESDSSSDSSDGDKHIDKDIDKGIDKGIDKDIDKDKDLGTNLDSPAAESTVRAADGTEQTTTNSNSNSNSNGASTAPKPEVKRKGVGTIFRDQLIRVSREATKGSAPGAEKSGLRRAHSLLLLLAKASTDVKEGGRHSSDFNKKMVRAARNPNSVRSRLWMLLELPSSSGEARGVRAVLMFLIVLSVFVLYTQTLTSLSHYGEETHICGELLHLYCHDKDDPILDPGCFNQNVDYQQKLLFKDCVDNDEQNCVRLGSNFGSLHTNLTCLTAADERSDDHGLIRPFQTQNQLIQEYGKPNIGNRREDSHMIYSICSRIECTKRLGVKSAQDGNVFWIPLEIVINLVFTVELALRIFVAESIRDFFIDILNIFDAISIIPFYTEVISGIGGNIDFSVLASSPEPLIFVAMKSLKVFRLFKITRHFKAAQVLIETAQKVWKQLIGMLVFLMFILTLFAILLFEVEQGTGCYVGDLHCHTPVDAVDIVTEGQLIFINKQGDLSQFPNALYGLWFSLVTMTSTGYGDITPSTNAGLVMAVVLMLFGAMYMAMPLTAAASVFYVIHESYNEQRQKKQIERKKSSELPTRKPSSDILKMRNGGDSTPVKKLSATSIIGGHRHVTAVAPEPQGQRPGVTAEQVALAGRFDQRLQRSMEQVMDTACNISSQIERLFEDLRIADPEGMRDVLGQAATIVTATSDCTTLLDKEDVATLEKLCSEFYKLSLLPR
jgi:hypothetical protein